MKQLKQRIVPAVVLITLLGIVVLGTACGNSSATATPPGSQGTAAPRRTAVPAAQPTQDVLDDSSASSGSTEETEEPGSDASPTQDLLDDSSANVTRTPKAAKTQASRPPTVSLALAPLMPSTVDAMVWTGSATAAQIDRVKQYFNGRQFLFSWREGDAGAMGAALKQIVEHCNGRYTLMGSREAQATQNAAQVTWRDQGAWDIVPSGNQILLTYRSASEQTQTVPVGIQTGGKVVVLNTSLVAERQGPAVCE